MVTDDARQKTASDQLEKFAGQRVAVCKCDACGEPFLARRRSRWCSGSCRKVRRRALIAQKKKDSPPTARESHHAAAVRRLKEVLTELHATKVERDEARALLIEEQISRAAHVAAQLAPSPFSAATSTPMQESRDDQDQR